MQNFSSQSPFYAKSISSSAVGQITSTVTNTPNAVKSPLLQEIWIYNFFLRTLERVFAGKIVNIIRNEL